MYKRYINSIIIIMEVIPYFFNSCNVVNEDSCKKEAV